MLPASFAVVLPMGMLMGIPMDMLMVVLMDMPMGVVPMGKPMGTELQREFAGRPYVCNVAHYKYRYELYCVMS